MTEEAESEADWERRMARREKALPEICKLLKESGLDRLDQVAVLQAIYALGGAAQR